MEDINNLSFAVLAGLITYLAIDTMTPNFTMTVQIEKNFFKIFTSIITSVIVLKSYYR